MTLTAQEQRIAALLSALGDDVAQQVLEQMPQEAGTRVRSLLEHFRDDPLSDDELENVLDEFMRFFRFAVQQEQALGQLKNSEAGTETAPLRLSTVDSEAVVETHAAELESASTEPNSAAKKKPFVPTGDPFQDLVQLEPFQIIGALRGESARTIGVVLNCLAPSQAGLGLQHLPEDMRAGVFMVLRDPPKMPRAMLEQIVRTTVSKGSLLDANAVADPAEKANRKMAELLRAMDQSQRGQMIRALEAQDPAIIEQIKRMLYVFDDLLRISNRTIQKILGEVDSQSLALALKGADAAVADKVMGNLSKRARATLTEEIEFLGQVKPNEQAIAQQTICDVIARLDESGELELE